VASGYAVGLLGAGLELVGFAWSVSFCGSSSHLRLFPVEAHVGSTVWRSALRFSFLWSSSWQFGCVKVDWVQRLWIGFSWAVDLLGSLMVFSPEADVPNQSPYPIWVSGVVVGVDAEAVGAVCFKV
ncbi:unnamed protein product, partial [Brassica napus]